MEATLSPTQQIFLDTLLKGINTKLTEAPAPAAAVETEADKALAELGNLLKEAKPGEQFTRDDKGHLVPVVTLGGLLSPIEKPLSGLSFGGLPVGSIALGGATGVLITEVINGLFDPAGATSKTTNLGAKVGAIFLLSMVGTKVFSKQATASAATVITAQVLSQVLPLDAWIDKIVAMLRGTGTANRLSNRTIIAGQGPLHGSPENDLLRSLSGAR